MKRFFGLVLVCLLVGSVATVAQAQPYGPKMNADCGDNGSGDPSVPTPCNARNGYDIYNSMNYLFTNAGRGDLATLTSNAGTDARRHAEDRVWTDFSNGISSNFVAISITARNLNTLGVCPPGVACPFNPVMSGHSGTGFFGDGSMSDPFPAGSNPLSGGDFGFALHTTNGGTANTWYSDPSLNSDGADHMLSFYMGDALAGWTVYLDNNNDGIYDENDGDTTMTFNKNTWLIAWEDLPIGSSDEDYNDSIFLVSDVRPIPEPLSLLLMGSGLAGLAATRKRRKV